MRNVLASSLFNLIFSPIYLFRLINNAFLDISAAEQKALLYVAGACQRQLKTEFDTSSKVFACRGVYECDAARILTENPSDCLSYIADKNCGGLIVPSVMIFSLGKIAFKVYADFIEAGLFASTESGACIPLLAALADKKMEAFGYRFWCDGDGICTCSDYSNGRLKGRALVYFFRTFVKVFSSTLNDRLSTVRQRLQERDLRSKQSRKLLKLKRNKV